MAEDVDQGAIAFHLIMALCSDLAVHDEPRLARMQDTLARTIEQFRKENVDEETMAEARAAYDALRQLDDTGQRSRLR